MSKFLDEAIQDFDRSQGDVSDGYNQVLKDYAKIKALFAIAEGLQEVVARLDTISTDLQNIQYDLETNLGCVK